MTKVSIWSTARHSQPKGEPSDSDKRTQYEIDYDRLLFSTPVRRLGDKTQVFPLEKNDSVRNRLTHSHEVSNLARSLGNRLSRTKPGLFNDDPDVISAVPVILSSVGLAHDLGNPPFGHQGEQAISSWFEVNKKLFIEGPKGVAAFQPVAVASQQDFLAFEGNAQALRLVARLQSLSGPSGLNLTAATLSALMKYPTSSDKVSPGSAATKKYGFFASERDIAEWIWSETGLSEGQRHPLTWIMEACDDIAYSVLDIEDTIKKGLVSPEDVLAYLLKEFSKTDLGGVFNSLQADFKQADSISANFSRVNETKTSRLRTRLIDRLINGACAAYLQGSEDIFAYKRCKSLLDGPDAESKLYNALKNFALNHAYRSSDVLRLEWEGHRVIHELMDILWEAISDRKDFEKPGSRRMSPRAAYAYSLVSDSYRWYFEQPTPNEALPIRYREMQLLTDMMSGMTDSFALELHAKLCR
jgi:dGTPase